MNKPKEEKEVVSENKTNDTVDNKDNTTDNVNQSETTASVDVSAYEEKIGKLTMIIADLENKVKYHQAELINYRKRKDEEVSNMLKFANQDLILELIPILDNFERAMKLSDIEDEKQAQFLEGFKMIYSHTAEVLKKFGVEEINPLGEKFDPNLHQALLVEQDKEKEDEIVLEVLLKGYTLKGKMIRPASVKINKIN